jgi:hypothetical protein
MKRLGLFAMAGVLVTALAGTASAQGWRGGGRGGGGAWHGGGGAWHGGGGWNGGGGAYRAAPLHSWGPNRWGAGHVYVRPVAPSRSHVWIPGYWGSHTGARVWIDGAWYLPPHPGWVWMAPHWAWNGYQWVWQEGYWGPPAY